MEREWRLYGELRFRLEDVRRVFLPANFASKLRSDFPDYSGQVSFTHEGESMAEGKPE